MVPKVYPEHSKGRKSTFQEFICTAVTVVMEEKLFAPTLRLPSINYANHPTTHHSLCRRNCTSYHYRQKVKSAKYIQLGVEEQLQLPQMILKSRTYSTGLK